jgi:hypothetical protein
MALTSGTKLGPYEIESPLGAGPLAGINRRGIETKLAEGQQGTFFFTDQQMMAVDVSQKGASLQLGTPHALFKASTVTGASGPYTVSADGKKSVINTVLPQSITEPLTLITNWPAAGTRLGA